MLRYLPRSIKQFLCHNLHIHIDLHRIGPLGPTNEYQDWCYWCGWRKAYALRPIEQPRFMEWS